ncbi:acetylornithine/succinyldiaminopimelate/putrescine aminotransferase [Bradyrhizobium huanghuaihaiense]
MTTATHPYDALMDITARPKAVFVRGAGSYLWDDGRKRYLDFVQGWAVNCLGHSPPAIADALAAQAKRLLTPSPAFYNEPSLKLAQALVENSAFDQVFFANSGAEANEGAIKLARKYGSLHRNGAFEIISFEGGFHGRTLATMSASGKKAFEPLFEPKVSGFKKAKLNDIASVEKLINANTVAVMLEPIQGESGVWPATDAFLRELRALTEAHGLLLIFDEIQTGMGRTGKLFHYEHAGISPDIMTLGKGIGGGVPLAALLATERASCFEHGDQGGTFNGNPIMCAAGLAVLEEVKKPDFLKSVTETGPPARKRAAEGLGPARARRRAGTWPAAGARPQAADRARDRRAGIRGRRAAERAAGGYAALHAGAECHEGRDRRDDRLSRRDLDESWGGETSGVTTVSCPGRSAAPLRRCAAEPGPISPQNPVPPPGSRLCAAA